MSYPKYLNWLMETDTRATEVSYEEWLAGSYPNDIALQRQFMVTSVVSGEQDRQGRPGAVMNETVMHSEDDLRAGIAAIARTRMARVASLMSYADKVEARLMSRINIEDASLDQLLSTARYLRGCAKDDMSIILGALNANQKSGLEGAQFNVNITDNILVGDSTVKGRDTRDKVRTVLDGFLKVVSKNASSNESGPPPSGSEDTGTKAA